MSAHPTRARPPLPWTVAAVGLVAVTAALLRTGAVGPTGTRRLDDLGQLLAAAAAGLSCLHRARGLTGRCRLAWGSIGVGASCWAAGQAVWSWYELVAQRATPFPSAADLGYLLYPVGAVVGALAWPGDGSRSRVRHALDGVLVAAALIIVSWASSLGAVWRAGSDGGLAQAVGLAYPIADVVVLTIVVLTLMRAPARTPLALLAGGLATMAAADSAFAYLTATGRYATGSLVDLGWLSAFALVALAARAANGDPEPAQTRECPRTRWLGTALPYLPLAVATALLVRRQLAGGEFDRVQLAAAALLLAAVLSRQYLTVLDNRRLVSTVAAREEELRQQAYSDPLTGLANRALLVERVQHALGPQARHGGAVGVLFVDLDDFKLVNDTLGHPVGDTLLQQVAARLRAALRPTDLIARLGGDEFAVLVDGDAGERVADELAERLLDALRAPFAIADQRLLVHASVGIAVVPAGTPVTVPGLLTQADVAMYAAKRQGKNACRAYRETAGVPTADELTLRADLAEAVTAGAITLAYQPIVQSDSGELFGLEALARWNRRGEPVPPDRFIPLADQLGVMGALGGHVLAAAIDQLARWPHERLLRVGVNVTPGQLADRALPERVLTRLAERGLDPGQLVLELTERAVLTDLAAAVRVATELRAYGVRLALDDFGAGFSSLQHLHRLPLTSVKIDRQFVASLDRDPSQSRFVRSFIDFAHSLELLVVGEGVERPGQLQVLRDLGCDLVQGFLLGHPAPPDQVTARLRPRVPSPR